MTIEKPLDGQTPAWTDEMELEFEIGDMNGIAFTETEVEVPKDKEKVEDEKK